MASDMNEIRVSGRLVATPEITHTANGTPVLRCAIANNRYYKPSGATEWKKDTAFIEIETWRDLAEFMTGFTKGQEIEVAGRLTQDRWTDQEGNRRERWKVVALNVSMKDSGFADLVPDGTQPPEIDDSVFEEDGTAEDPQEEPMIY